MFFRRKLSQDEITRLYQSVLDSARQEKLYTDYGVADTPTGRFQMIILHAAPHIMAFAKAGQTKKSQALFDMIFRDVELSFREIGIGDLSVPKKMKAFMQEFNGILQAHGAANADHVAITARNVFGADSGDKMSPAFQSYIIHLFKC